MNYVLTLEHGCYYIGRTTKDNVNHRFLEHFMPTRAASWCKVHKPMEILEATKGDRWEEDAIVLRYMHAYGVDKVRGGSYSTITLAPEILAEITRKFDSADNRCFRCHKEGHFANKCGHPLDERKTIRSPRARGAMYCIRCMRTSHNITECTAAETISNIPLLPCQKCLSTNHLEQDCKETANTK